MTAAAHALLEELAARGVTVATRGADLALRPAAALDPGLRERLCAHKADLLAVLAITAQADRGSDRSGVAVQETAQEEPQDGRDLLLVFTWDGGPTPEEEAEERLERAAIRAEGWAPGESLPPSALLPEGADPAAPPAGWTFCREGGLAGCWVGPGGELAPGRGEAP